MRIQNYTFDYYNFANSETINIILHGINKGIEDEFFYKIKQEFVNRKQSFVLIQMPFKDRGESALNYPNFFEEIDCVSTILDKININFYQKIHFVGKSLGGIVLSKYLTLNIDKIISEEKIKLTILGFVVDYIKLADQKNLFVNIIQGQNDIYGSFEYVQNNIAQYKHLEYKIKLIKNADHSYNSKSGKPIYWQKAIDAIFEI